MNSIFSNQLHIFFVFAVLGLCIGVLYDVLRILRELLPHKRWIIGLEDIVFWTISGFFIFKYIYETNSGALRGFIFIGLIITLGSYMVWLSPWMVKTITTLLKIIFKPVLIFFKPFAILIKKLVWVLKKTMKWLIMKLRIMLKVLLKEIYIIRKKI